jgi:hypothetical protein
MFHTNGVVHSTEQEQPKSLTEEKVAAAAGEQRLSDVSSPASTGAPESYQGKFFSVLHDIVSSAQDNIQKSSISGKRIRKRTDIVARLLTLSRRLDDGWNPALYQQAYFAARLWKDNSSDRSTVSAVIDDIEFASSRNSPIYTVMYGLITSMLCLSFGALAVLTLTSLVYAWSSSRLWQDVISDLLKLLASPLIVASTFGMLGAAVSVLLRLSEFENATRRSRHFLWMTGGVLPFVGVVFASVICALFESGIVNVSLEVDSKIYFFIVIGFLSGFSERFTRGLLGTAERSLTTTLSEEQTTLQTDRATLNKVTHNTNVMKDQTPAA